MKDLRIAPALFVLTLVLGGVDGIFASQKSISLTAIGTYASDLRQRWGRDCCL